MPESRQPSHPRLSPASPPMPDRRDPNDQHERAGDPVISERMTFSAGIVYGLLVGIIGVGLYIANAASNVAVHLTRIDDRLFTLEQKAGIASQKSGPE